MIREKFVWAAAPLLALALVRPAAAADEPTAVQPSTPPTALQPSTRPAALVPLYVSFAALQVADAATTLDNVRGGATEANPVMSGLVGSPKAFVATKLALAGVSIYCSEKLWKRHRAAAVALMIGLNGLSAAVVARNYATRAGR